MGLKKSGARKAHGGVRLSKLPVSTAEQTEHRHHHHQRHVVQELDAVFAYSEIPDEVLVGTELDLSVSSDSSMTAYLYVLMCVNAYLCVYVHWSLSIATCAAVVGCRAGFVSTAAPGDEKQQTHQHSHARQRVRVATA